jgi:hypothetical protein
MISPVFGNFFEKNGARDSFDENSGRFLFLVKPSAFFLKNRTLPSQTNTSRFSKPIF